jgi:hypothetical protein
MTASVLSPAPRGLASPSNGRRIFSALGVALVFGALNSLPATAPTVEVTIAHAVVVRITVVLALELARGEMQRQALDSRLNLLQAQVAPPAACRSLSSASVSTRPSSSCRSPTMTTPSTRRTRTSACKTCGRRCASTVQCSQAAVNREP